jgi:hypothetical protein
MAMNFDSNQLILANHTLYEVAATRWSDRQRRSDQRNQKSGVTLTPLQRNESKHQNFTILSI